MMGAVDRFVVLKTCIALKTLEKAYFEALCRHFYYNASVPRGNMNMHRLCFS
jgi:hypothetical protein